MKPCLLLITFAFSSLISTAQYNTFPASGNVGIGISSPLQKLTIRSSGTLTGNSSTDYDFGITDGSTYQIQLLGLVNSIGNYGLFQVVKGGIGAGNLVLQTQGGNVGIGSTIPEAKLHIQSDANTSGAPSNSQVIISGITNPEKRLSLAYNTSSNYAELQSQAYSGAYTTITLNPNGGNVGIGTNDPKDYRLAVNGKIRAQEIKVEASPWPDYVFTNSYSLPTLQETEKHIKENGHLPGIPSAAEVKANGIDLGEMNAKLLQKIEELTLHLIELKKQSELRDEKQNKEIAELKSKLK
ncbi:hypothetical protein FBD94_23100 [Pedobacter hiemivivus]|uniref:BZIP transcription factor n=1 Tax=Pedobacter hiemivivus TaxID=2530454 RepID=A0A4U1G2S9_9SPHI|nr:tail fiber protein [Pedobacter hiemivivus]TKC56603.1 hypothetical protein FBD94_23100 [Pedobacter hiemivivus]